MHRASIPVRILSLIGAVVLFSLVGGGAWAVADDFIAREVLPTGATVAGVDVSGLTRSEARERILSEVAEPMAEPITVTHDDRSFVLDAGEFISVDVEAMVDEAFEPKARASLASRVIDRVLDTPYGAEADVRLTIDSAALETWLADVASQVDTAPADATLTVNVNQLVVVASRKGETLDPDATRLALEEALTAGEKTVPLAVDYIEPAVTEEDLGPAIVVDISERRLYLYRDGVVEKEYGVAVGTPSYPTPRGNYTIILKRYMPTWSNPGSAWAADMPKTIGPGPSNPLGTRALNLDAPGIRIHGTSKDYSIGTAASHGCMRMHRWDIEDLYDRVEVGTPVFIVN